MSRLCPSIPVSPPSAGYSLQLFKECSKLITAGTGVIPPSTVNTNQEGGHQNTGTLDGANCCHKCFRRKGIGGRVWSSGGRGQRLIASSIALRAAVAQGERKCARVVFYSVAVDNFKLVEKNPRGGVRFPSPLQRRRSAANSFFPYCTGYMGPFPTRLTHGLVPLNQALWGGQFFSMFVTSPFPKIRKLGGTQPVVSLSFLISSLYEAGPRRLLFLCPPSLRQRIDDGEKDPHPTVFCTCRCGSLAPPRYRDHNQTIACAHSLSIFPKPLGRNCCNFVFYLL